jgi:hypothetical protein
MTKKDYKLIAKALNNVMPYNKEHQALFMDVIDSLSDELIKDNPLFNKDKFIKACTIE